MTLFNDKILLKITHNLEKKHGCHTILLYGSRARGESTSASDYDIIAVRKSGEFERDCRIFDGCYLDAFIYSEQAIQNPDISFVRIKDGIVVCQRENIGSELLRKVKEIFRQGPPQTPAWEKHEIISWFGKMLTRAKENDIEGNFRRHWLLHDLLECYFKLRDFWYLGPKESFGWLKINDPLVYLAFEIALKSDASLSDIEKLVGAVLAGKAKIS